MIIQLFQLIILFLISSNVLSQNIESNFNEIDDTFTKMELKGIKTNAERSYQYYFDGSRAQLSKLEKTLLKDNYQTIILLRIHLNHEDSLFLSAEKIESHTRETLKKTIMNLTALAQKYGANLPLFFYINNKNPKEPIITKNEIVNHLEGLTNSNLFVTSKKLYEFKEYSSALIGFNKCVQRKIKVDTSLFYLANCLVEADELEKSLAILKKVIEINPKYEKAKFNSAVISYDLGIIEGAIKYYTEVLEITPKNDVAYYGIATSEYMKGNHKKAKKNCKKALEINPNNTLAQELLKTIKRFWLRLGLLKKNRYHFRGTIRY